MLVPANQYPLAVDAQGNPLEIVEDQTGYLVRRATGGRPGIENYLGMPLTVPIDASRHDVVGRVTRAGILRLYPIDQYGNEIPGAPVAILEVTPEEINQGLDAPHWMRLDRVFDALDRSMTAMEARDMILSQVMKSLIENNTALQNGAVRLLDTANTTISVANGIERPELDTVGLAKEIVEQVKSGQEEQTQRTPWFVMLLNGECGQRIADFATNLLGVFKPADENG